MGLGYLPSPCCIVVSRHERELDVQHEGIRMGIEPDDVALVVPIGEFNDAIQVDISLIYHFYFL